MLPPLLATEKADVLIIPFERLAIMLLPLIVVGVIYWLWVSKPYEVGWATLRMATQLLLVGYVLAYLFESRNLWLGVAVVCLMMSVASWIAMRSIKRKSAAIYLRILLSIGTGGSLVLALVYGLVLPLDALYDPSFLIPLGGMIYANSMNAVSLSAERFEYEIGKTGDYLASRRDAYRASLIPQINSFLAVGLVSLPGILTGQVISGVDPLIAVRYQIVVMAMILGAAGICVAIFLTLMKPKGGAP